MAYKRQTFLNGQYVNIEQTPASIGHRIGAVVVDMIVMYVLMTGGSLIGVALASRLPESVLVGLMAIVVVFTMLYHPICEQIMGGSIGKRATGLRVVMHNGEAVSISASLLRWLFSYLDYLGFGLLVMLCNKRNMRLGDLAGGSMVVAATTARDAIAFDNSMKRFVNLKEDYEPAFAFAADLTWGQVSFINRTMSAYKYIEKGREFENICTLANYLSKKYQVSGVTRRSSLQFLRQIVNDYNYYTWEQD